MLEVGKLYIVKTRYGYNWLFKKTAGHFITTCRCCVCLDDNSVFENGGRVCNDDDIAWIKFANRNYIAFWNRTFNDNVEMV